MDNKERVNEMENILNWIKGAAAAIGGIAAYIWGGWDPLIIVLVAMVSIDYITGVINAGLQHGLSSQVGFKGLLKKIVIFMIVAVGTLLGLDSDTFYIYHVAAVMVDNLRRLLLGINLSDKAVMDFDFPGVGFPV